MDVDRAERTLLLLAEGERGVKLEFERTDGAVGAVIQITGGFGNPAEVHIELHAFIQTPTSTNRTTQAGHLNVEDAVGAIVTFLSTFVEENLVLKPSSWERLTEIYAACCGDERETAFQTLLKFEHESCELGGNHHHLGAVAG
ncbi:hypothetical protein [Rhizobium leguminosarum]|uniref:hypothetical protein n=1 Tax=Rhizobium leguminosarum TaxID=384 RepID=UPI00103A4E39|nr:hypothetical protein [Rhizobium leguminosarum]TCA82280.1 hypothetical protein E0H74_20965 [Rhizobium leguminosarum bv. viciae]TCA92743.1 hypothetical protein E0H76_22315 [Rhizobium leguminosarum bv. viciae]